MSPPLRYRLDVPMDDREARSRRLEPGPARLLVWVPQNSKKIGYLKTPEVLIDIVFEACTAPKGVFVQPLNSHLPLAAYAPKLKQCSARHAFYPNAVNASDTRVLTVHCGQRDLLVATVAILKCEAIAVFPALDAWPLDDLLASVARPIPDNQYASAYLKFASTYGLFGFLSHGHDNAEILGLRSKLLEVFGNLVNKFEGEERAGSL